MEEFSGKNIFRFAKDKWDILKQNTIFSKISFLITAAMSLSICSFKEIKWSPFGVELISLEAVKKQIKAVDIIDAIIETFTWIAETGWQCFVTRSLEPILYSDQSMAEYNKQYEYVHAYSDSALAGNIDDLSDFESKLKKVIDRTIYLKKIKTDGPTALWLQSRYSLLVEIQERLICKRRNTQLRFQPIGFSLCGKTGVGKSTLGKITMNTSLHNMGYTIEKEKQLTHDSFDKYQSTYTSDIEGVFLDDVANLKSDFATGEQIPSAIIIKFFNNVAAQAVKAEINEKGVVFINFKCGVVTTNVKELNAGIYSNCPSSILRRLYHVDVQIKDEYRKKGGVSLDTNNPLLEGRGITHDIWKLKIEECISTQSTIAGDVDLYHFKVIEVDIDDRHIICENLNLEDYLLVVKYLSIRHKKHQDGLLKSNNAFEKMCYCCHGLPDAVCSTCCEIKPESFEVMSNLVVNSCYRAGWNYINSYLSPISFINGILGYSPIYKITEKQLTKEIHKMMNDKITPVIIGLIPEFVLNYQFVQKYLTIWQNAAATRDMVFHYRFCCCWTIALMLLSIFKCDITKLFFSCIFGLLTIIPLTIMKNYRMKHYKERFIQSRNALPQYVTYMKSLVKPSTLLCGATLLIGIQMISMWNTYRKSVKPQSEDKDEKVYISKSDVDKQPGWFGFMSSSLGIKVKTDPISNTTETSDLIEGLKKNLCWARFTRPDGSVSKCNIFFPQKFRAWFPQHIFYQNGDLTGKPCEYLSIEVFRHKNAGGKFKFKVDHCNSIIVPEMDMVECFVPNMFDCKNLVKWLPLSRPVGTSSAVFLSRREDISFSTEVIAVKFCNTGHKYKKFFGGIYQGCSLIGEGSCMSIIVRDGKNPCILGFHIGGNSTVGVCQTITNNESSASLKLLENLDGILISASEGIFPEAQYGKPVLSGPVHPHSHFCGYTDEQYVDVVGSAKLRATTKSEVIPSILTDSVAEICGVENIWGPPQMNPNWKHYNVGCDSILENREQFRPSELAWSRTDWMKPLISCMRKHCKEEKVQPLSLKECILGIPGKRFMDPIPMKTSAGFPLFGPKKRLFEDVFSDDGQLVDRIPDNSVIEEMDRIVSAWKKGERAYPVFTACLKDEPMKVTKTKVRVFIVIPLAYSLLIRKYFLPIIRFLGTHPIESEMAVGINCQGPQWDRLMEYVERFSDDGEGNFGMDHRSFDTHMSSQMTADDYWCFYTLAKYAGYPEDVLYEMRMCMADFIHPCIDYNGTIAIFYDSNTSGNNMTVQVNGASNSKYLRIPFYRKLVQPIEGQIPEEKLPVFRDYVAATTYGDDNKGSVAASIRNLYNYLVIKHELALNALEITPPDKESAESEFYPLKDLDFLKRHSVYIPEIKRSLGAIDQMSIFKSLHMNLKSKTATPREVAISCLETAAHEFFAHGREIYDQRVSELRTIAGKHDLVIPALNKTFDERVAEWLDLYDPLPQDGNKSVSLTDTFRSKS
jgi:hypothetical protein